MTIAAYDLSSSVRHARQQYFEVNAFGDDGGYADDWVDFKLGPIPFPFPNTAARKRAVRYHDLHHIATGYDTDTTGEFEISAWELGAGCKDFYAAWQLNLAGLAAGVLVAPRRVFRAFCRGRRSRTVYGEPIEPVLDGTVDALRSRTIDVSSAPIGVIDAALFALATMVGLVTGGVFLVIATLLLPIAFASIGIRALRRSRATSA